MTQHQINEINKTVDLLEECRTHMTNAMYRMGDIDDPSYLGIRNAYKFVCKAMDELPNY